MNGLLSLGGDMTSWVKSVCHQAGHKEKRDSDWKSGVLVSETERGEHEGD